jgi:hypothetical protein
MYESAERTSLLRSGNIYCLGWCHTIGLTEAKQKLFFAKNCKRYLLAINLDICDFYKHIKSKIWCLSSLANENTKISG